MDDNIDPDNCIINDDLRMAGICSALAPEVYIKASSTNELFALHPKNFQCRHRIVLVEWPSAGLWRELFHMYGILDEFSFCKYVCQVENTQIVREQTDRIHDLLQSFNYSAARFGDIAYTASLFGYKRQLFLEKKIPVKFIRLLDNIDDKIFNELARFLILKEVNGNIAKEIISSWIDLTDKGKVEVIQSFEKIFVNSSLDSKIQISEEFRNVVYKLRYPEITELTNNLNFLKNKVSKNIKLDFDPKFEKHFLKICAEVENNNDLHKFISSINDNHNIIILEQLVNLLNQA